MKLRKGLYETVYGNTALVASPDAKTAKDLDSGERIPIQMVDEYTWRPFVVGVYKRN